MREPRQMIQAEAFTGKAVFRHVEHRGQLLDEFARRIADPIHRITAAVQRLGHDTAGIGEVEDQTIRMRQPFDFFTIIQQDRNRAHRHRKAAGAGCFLG